MADITGGCLCGAVRYTISEPPKVVRACWCRLCQKVGAGSHTVNAVFAKKAVNVTGKLGEYQCTAESGNHMHRFFCPGCGIHVCTTIKERPEVMSVRAGTLDDPEIAKPEVTIWTKMAPSWAVFDERIPRKEEQG